MSGRILRTFAIIAALAPASLVAAGTASAVGPGTFTKITTPSSNIIYKFNGNPGATNNLTVSGTASADVTSVDIDCVFLAQHVVVTQVLAGAVPVTGGSFSTTFALPGVVTNCRLRAIPTGVNAGAGDYIGSYAGPLLYGNMLAPATSGGTTFGYFSRAQQGSGSVLVSDAGNCGVQHVITIAPPSMTLLGPGSSACAINLPSANITTSGTSTASALRVDGHNAYLPGGVASFLNGSQSLGLPQTKLTTTFTRRSSGDVTITESAPLVRCSVDDTYPPSHTSCPALVKTGAAFARTVDIFRGAHQVRLRDSYISTNSSRHTVSAQYQAATAVQPAGATGYVFPRHSSSFGTAFPDKVVTGLGTRAGTMLVRSDLHAVEGDEQADTIGWTWSRAPSRVQFSHNDPNAVAMPYSLAVPPAAGRVSVSPSARQTPPQRSARWLRARSTRWSSLPRSRRPSRAPSSTVT